MRTCSVCDKPVVRSYLCNRCYKQWGNNGDYPLWLKALIKFDNRFYMANYRHPILFMDFEEIEDKYVHKMVLL